jgi:WD40 repeat protein
MRSAYLIALSLALLISSRATTADAPDLAKKLHLIVVVDSLDPGIGRDCAEDRESVIEIFETAFDDAKSGFKGRLSVTKIDGLDYKPETVRKAIDKLAVHPDDAIFFFYSGHGGLTDEKGHFLHSRSGPIYRTELRAQLLGKQARLLAIMTDCCAKRVDFDSLRSAASLQAAQRDKWRVLRNLFLEQKGLIDVQSSQEGVVSWGGANGSMFTTALCKMLLKPAEALDTNKDGFVDWKEFFTSVRAQTLAIFQQVREKSQMDDFIRTTEPQTPYAFNLPSAPVRPLAALTISEPVKDRVFTALDVSRDGGVVLTGDSNGGLRRWDWRQGKETLSFEKPGDYVSALGLSADGKLAFSSELVRDSGTKRSERTTRIWDTTGGKELRQIDLKAFKNRQGCRLVGGDLAVFDDSDAMIVWDWRQQKPIGRFAKSSKALESAALLPDGKSVRILDKDAQEGRCSFVTYDCSANERKISQLSQPIRAFASAFSADGRLCAVAVAPVMKDDGPLSTATQFFDVEIWDCLTMERIAVVGEIKGGTEPQLAFSPDGRLLAVAGRDRASARWPSWRAYTLGTDVAVWNVKSGKEVLRIGDLPPPCRDVRSVRSIRFAGDPNVFFVAYGDQVRLYRTPE